MNRLDWIKAVEFHGHECPGLAIGFRARIFNSVVCESCGENTAEHKMRLQDGKKVCLDCFKDYSRGW